MSIRRRYEDLRSENRNKWVGYKFIHQNYSYHSAKYFDYVQFRNGVIRAVNSGIITKIEIINNFNANNIICVHFLNEKGEINNFCIAPLSTESLLIEE